MLLVQLAYRKIGWFALTMANHKLEPGWMYWDKRILIDWDLRGASENAGAVLPAFRFVRIWTPRARRHFLLSFHARTVPF